MAAERALLAGLLDQAERLYADVAERDPRDSIAVVGLARVAVERGDELRALELGRRAMAIDPDNPAATRLVDRIIEVMRYRGQDVPPPPPPEKRSLVDRLRRRA